MKRWTWWLMTVGLLGGVFHGGSQLTVSASVKHRSPTARFGHSRSPKHNSIASYYRGVHRPAQQTCVEAELPERVRDAEAIFTGTVRDMVDHLQYVTLRGHGRPSPWCTFFTDMEDHLQGRPSSRTWWTIFRMDRLQVRGRPSPGWTIFKDIAEHLQGVPSSRAQSGTWWAIFSVYLLQGHGGLCSGWTIFKDMVDHIHYYG